MKKIKILILALLTVVLAACSESEGFYSTNAIKGSEAFNQEEDNYLVYFYSPVCQHCQAFKPTLEKYVRKEDALPIYKVNLNNASENPTWEQYQIQGTPTLIHVKRKNGVIYEVNRLVGGQDLDTIPTTGSVYSDEPSGEVEATVEENNEEGSETSEDDTTEENNDTDGE